MSLRRPRAIPKTRRRAGAGALIAGWLVLAACGSGDDADPASTRDTTADLVDTDAAVETTVAANTMATTTTAATTTTELAPSTTVVESGFIDDAEPLTIAFDRALPGTYRVDSLGTPFSLTVEGDWRVQPNQPGWTVLTDPASQGPSDKDVVFFRPSHLADPTDPGACCDVENGWPLDDIQGWLANIVDGVVVSGPEQVEIGGRDAVSFEVEIVDAAVCGEDYDGEGVTGPPFCVGFVSMVEDGGFTAGFSFEPDFRVRIYWVDQGDQPPVVVLVGTPIGETSFTLQADALLETLYFGDPQPHPIP